MRLDRISIEVSFGFSEYFFSPHRVLITCFIYMDGYALHVLIQ